MADDAEESRVSLRLPQDLLDWTDGVADMTGESRSELIRRSIHFMREAQGGEIEREVELVNEIDQQIEENQKLRLVMPSKWRSHVRGLLVDDVKDGCSPVELKTLGDGYRKQAAQYEELAAEIDNAPESDLVGIVDEELNNAIQAADVSNWYDDVENPYEKRLSGVEEGMAERQDAITALQGAVLKGNQMAAAFSNKRKAPPVRPENLGRHMDSILPSNVSREDVAQLATHLVRQGVASEDVPDVVPAVDPTLEPEEIEARVDDVDVQGPEVDAQDVTVRRGGQEIDDEQPDDADDPAPLPTSASEATQEQLAALAAADGGRSDGNPFRDDESDMEDTDMEPDNTDEYDSIEDVDDRLDELSAGEPEAQADE